MFYITYVCILTGSKGSIKFCDSHQNMCTVGYIYWLNMEQSWIIIGFSEKKPEIACTMYLKHKLTAPIHQEQLQPSYWLSTYSKCFNVRCLHRAYYSKLLVPCIKMVKPWHQIGKQTTNSGPRILMTWYHFMRMMLVSKSVMRARATSRDVMQLKTGPKFTSVWHPDGKIPGACRGY